MCGGSPVRMHHCYSLRCSRSTTAVFHVCGRWPHRNRLHRTVPRSERNVVGCASLRLNPGNKFIYVEPKSKEALTAGLESGIDTFVFQGEGARATAAQWSQLGRFNQLFVNADNLIVDEAGAQLGRQYKVADPADVKALEAAAASGSLQGMVVMDAAEWKVIPAENLVALLQAAPSPSPGATPCCLMAAVSSAAEAEAMLGALEAGTHGVVLRTASGAEVRQLSKRLKSMRWAGGAVLPLQPVRVTRVVQVGTGDRVCVDLACMMRPGEGLLVGSFALGLFLVHSECEESQYINSRPFRVNAGPVHAYVHAPGGRTAYLSELRSGAEAIVVDAQGRQRAAVVGRVKVEARPLVLVEAVTQDGKLLSLQLQNAETVKLVGPAKELPRNSVVLAGGAGGTHDVQADEPNASAAATAGGGTPAASPCSDAYPDAAAEVGGGPESMGRSGTASPSLALADAGMDTSATSVAGRGAARNANDEGSTPARKFGTAAAGNADSDPSSDGSTPAGPMVGMPAAAGWRAISVASLAVGDEVYALVQGGARHTGIAIEEFIVEK